MFFVLSHFQQIDLIVWLRMQKQLHREGACIYFSIFFFPTKKKKKNFFSFVLNNVLVTSNTQVPKSPLTLFFGRNKNEIIHFNGDEKRTKHSGEKLRML